MKPEEELPFQLGKVVQATRNLTSTINGLRNDLKPIGEELQNHRERFIHGDNEFKSLKSKIKMLFAGILLIILFVVPQAWPGIWLFIKARF